MIVFEITLCPGGEIGRRTALRWQHRNNVCWFESSPGHHSDKSSNQNFLIFLNFLLPFRGAGSLTPYSHVESIPFPAQNSINTTLTSSSIRATNFLIIFSLTSAKKILLVRHQTTKVIKKTNNLLALHLLSQASTNFSLTSIL
jgi:hypothetical protein